MNTSDFVSPEHYANVVSFGRTAGDRWFSALRSHLDGMTNLKLNRGADGFPDNIYRTLFNEDTTGWLKLDMLATFFVHGPKYFAPTTLQWEDIELVDMKLPVSDFSSPFPAISILLPHYVRDGLSRRFGFDTKYIPSQCLIRWRKKVGELSLVSGVVGYPLRSEHGGVMSLFEDDSGTVEEAARKIEDRHASKHVVGSDEHRVFKMSWEVFRTCMNLCLMLSHFGCRIAPDDRLKPKNRKERRERERDFAAVEMIQNIVLRDDRSDTPPINPLGVGHGEEKRPHWRRGHWRAYPGQAKLRAEGQNPKLLFVRPCLVRRDRMLGDESDTSTTYIG